MSARHWFTLAAIGLLASACAGGEGSRTGPARAPAGGAAERAAATVELADVKPQAAPAATPGAFQPMTPVRVLDTRAGAGQGGPAFGPGETRNVTLAGASIPAGAVSVALNVTVTQPSTTSFLTVWPQGTPAPDTSNVNVVAGQTVANLVIVGLGNGRVSIRNAFGTAHVIVDVMGWFSAGFEGVVPTRLMDTRRNLGGAVFGPGETRNLAVAGIGGIPAGATAVALNVTVTQPSATSFVTVWPAGGSVPATSNLNMTAGQTVPNLVVVGLGNGQVSIRNAFGTAHVIVDVMGWFSSGFRPVTPARVADTRSGQCGTVLAAGETREVAVAGIGGVPATGATAVALNLTVTQPSAGGFYSVWPAGAPLPGTSNLNFVPGQTVANLVVVGVGASGHVAIKNSSASAAQVIVDLMGWFDGTSGYTANGTCTVAPPPTTITKMLWIWEENTSPEQILGTCTTCLQMPWLNNLANTYGQASNVRAASFPSLPNYIAGTSGDYFGIADDSLPAKHPLNVANLFTQLPPGQAMVFAESMTKNCQLDDGAHTDINGAGFYTVRRTAWPYYTNPGSKPLCDQYMVPMQGNLDAKIASGLPLFSEVVPATCNNFHKGGTGTDVCVFGPGETYKTRADKWLQKTITKVMTGPDWQAGRLAIAIIWDEGFGPTPPFGADCTQLTLGGCHVPLVIASPNTHAVKDPTLYTTYSLLRTAEEIFGVPLLLKAATAPSLRPNFGL